jgi:hypothetical protein
MNLVPSLFRQKQERLPPLPDSDGCSPWPPGISGDGALASVAFESTSYDSFTEEIF